MSWRWLPMASNPIEVSIVTSKVCSFFFSSANALTTPRHEKCPSLQINRTFPFESWSLIDSHGLDFQFSDTLCRNRCQSRNLRVGYKTSRKLQDRCAAVFACVCARVRVCACVRIIGLYTVSYGGEITMAEILTGRIRKLNLLQTWHEPAWRTVFLPWSPSTRVIPNMFRDLETLHRWKRFCMNTWNCIYKHVHTFRFLTVSLFRLIL